MVKSLSSVILIGIWPYQNTPISKTSKGAGDRPPNEIIGHIESGEFAATCDIVREISAEGI